MAIWAERYGVLHGVWSTVYQSDRMVDLKESHASRRGERTWQSTRFAYAPSAKQHIRYDLGRAPKNRSPHGNPGGQLSSRRYSRRRILQQPIDLCLEPRLCLRRLAIETSEHPPERLGRNGISR
jgi:hypothetical protein